MTTERTELEARVKRGAELLDANVPDWANVVDVESLDVQSTFQCVLSQIFGGYCVGLRRLGIVVDEGREHGFDVPIEFEDDGYEGVDYEYDALTKAWANAALERK